MNDVQYNVCDPDAFENYIGDNNGSLWIYPTLLKKNYKIFIYSGDLDSSVPITGTKTWMARFREEFDIPVKKIWR